LMTLRTSSHQTGLTMIMDDPDATKPDDWAEEHMVDPAAKKPSDWDTEEDGEYEKPMIKNPAFQGEWVAGRIYNKEFKGPYHYKRIDNPEYAGGEKEVYKFNDLSYVGFDLWQQTGGTVFDNIIICDDVNDAAAFAASWKELNQHEKAARIEDDAKEVREAEEKKKRAEAARVHAAAVAAEKVAKREEYRKMGYDDDKLDRLERARVRARANEEDERHELERNREEQEDEKMMGDAVGKIQRQRNRQAVARNEGAFARARALEEAEDNKKEAESGGILIPPDEIEAAIKNHQDTKQEL